MSRGTSLALAAAFISGASVPAASTEPMPESSLRLVPLWTLEAAAPVEPLVPEPRPPLRLTSSNLIVVEGGALAAFDDDAPVIVELRATGGGDVTINAGAFTTLSDGGLRLAPARPAGLSPSNETDQFHAGMVESGEGEFQLYAVDMTWRALRDGPLSIGVATGLRAIRADVSRDVGGGDDVGFKPVPVIGTDVRLDVSEAAYVSGTALTQMIDAGGDVLDLKAEAGISFTRSIDFAVGYQYLRSSVDAGARDATLEQEGPFARLRISF